MTQWPDARWPQPQSPTGGDEPTEVVPTPEDLTFPGADAEPTAALPVDLPAGANEPTQAFTVEPGTHDPTEALPTFDGSSSDPTQAFGTPAPSSQVEEHRTQVLPTMDAPEPAVAATSWLPPGHEVAPTQFTAQPVPPDPAAMPPGDPTPEPDDVRGSDTWAWQMSKTQNRASTDVGLLLLRLFSLPLVLHGIRQLLTFNEFVSEVSSAGVGAVAPEAIAIVVIVAQTILPVLLALGFGTRIAAGLQAILMGTVYALAVVSTQAIVDSSTGALTGETTLAYVALSLPLVFTGPGRFSLDHGLTAERRDKVVRRRVEKRVKRGNV